MVARNLISGHSSIRQVCACLGLTLLVISSTSCGGSGSNGSTPGSIQATVGVPSQMQVAFINASSGNQFVGYGSNQNETSGIIYTGTPTSATILDPAGFDIVYLWATDGANQVGAGHQVGVPDVATTHALMFSGTNASMIDLHPAGYTSSVARGVDGNIEVGSGTLSGHRLPLIWHGTAGSAASVLPVGFTDGGIRAVLGNTQVGSVSSADYSSPRAAVWHGTAASFQNITPPGYVFCAITGLSSKDMVGSAALENDPGLITQNPGIHALRWVNGVATDLHPATAYQSQALATNGSIQVGLFSNNDQFNSFHACMWKGTAASFVDLHQYLPAGYLDSVATSVQGKTITGWAETSGGSDVAVVWRLP